MTEAWWGFSGEPSIPQTTGETEGENLPTETVQDNESEVEKTEGDGGTQI